MDLEAQKRAPIYEALERFRKKREDRLSWGLFRDRRPEMYGKICSAI